MFAAYPRGNATSAQAYNYTIRSDTSSGTVYFVQLFYEFPDDKDMTAEVALARSGATYTVKGVHFHVFPRSALAANDFSLKRIPPSGYFILAMLIGAVGITICALIACIMTHGIRRKWLWILFILIGFGKVSLNWTTGQLFFAPLSFQLFSAGAMRSGLDPWVVSVSIPLGAILFLAKRKSLPGTVESVGIDTEIA